MRAWIVRRILRLFRTLSRISLWFETRFTAVGRLIIGGAVAAAVFGVDPRQTLAFQLAAVLIALIIVAMLASLRWRPRLECKRNLPDTVTVGTAISYSISITNHGNTVQGGLVLADRLLTRYPTPKNFLDAKAGLRQNDLNWFDRRVGFPRWLDLVRRSRGARLLPVPVPTIAAHSTVKVTIALTPLRRGKLIFTDLEVKRPDPLGIFFAKHRVRLHGDLVSLPKRYPVPPLHWISERHFHRGGLTLAATVGDSEEFVGLRDYRPGDPLRHIHWRSFAKRGTPVVKEYQDEYFDRHALIIDTYAGGGPPNYFEAAISVAASFIQTPRPSDSILDLVFIEQQVWQLTTGRGLSNNHQILTQLAELQPTGADEFEHLAAYLRRYLDRLASIIMVTPTWDPVRQAFVDELHRRRMRCLVLRINEAAPDNEDAAAVTGRIVRPSLLERDIANIAVPV